LVTPTNAIIQKKFYTQIMIISYILQNVIQFGSRKNRCL